MAENKTKPTEASVADFLEGVVPAARRNDAQRICHLIAKVTCQPPVMWGSSIVGFGIHHYRYASGREGDICRVGFSLRKAATVLYLSCDLDRHRPILDRLGKHERGVGCLYIKRLEDLDLQVLEELVATAWRDG